MPIRITAQQSRPNSEKGSCRITAPAKTETAVVRLANTVARAMYARHGYIESGIIPCEFNGIPDVGLVCMEKMLLP